MAFANKSDAVDFLIGDPGEQFDERYARIMQIVICPLRRVARDQAARIENQLLEVDGVKLGHREGHAASPTSTWILRPSSAAQMSADAGRRSRSTPLPGSIFTVVTRSTPEMAAMIRWMSLGHSLRPNGHPCPSGPPSIGSRNAAS